jgi:hypothetical protein
MADGNSSVQGDQGTAPWFRFLLLVQVLAAGLFGIVPYFLTGVAAEAGGYPGTESFIYRLAGAATIGYVVAAASALVKPGWYRFRIPAAAAYTFNSAALIAALMTLFESRGNFWVWFILFAAAAFVLVLIYVTRRNEGPPAPAQPTLDRPARVLLVLASLAAAFFGLAPLLAAEWFANFAAFDPSDLFIYRLAGAATFGYAFAGYLSIKDGRWEAIRVQNLAAIAFNGLSAIAALVFVVGGGSSWVAWLILIAASLFTGALVTLHLRRGRLTSGWFGSR